MVSLLYTLSLVASLVSSVAAHGIVVNVEAGGESYSAADVVRPFFGQDPLYGRTSPQLICNNDGDDTTPSQVTVAAGGEITFQWDWTPAHHPGFIDEFLAFCGADKEACNGFNVQGAVWFKIGGTGLLEPSTNYDGGNWAADQLQRQGNRWTITLPPNLKPGAYALRHTIVAMHLVGNPETYPACIHIFVTGSGTGVPDSSDLISIPGYMSTPQATEALDFNIFAIYESYELPGPPVAVLSSGGSAPAPAPASPASTTSRSSSSSFRRPASTGKPKPQNPAPVPEEDPEDPEECGNDDDDDTTSSGSSAPSSYNPKPKPAAASSATPPSSSPETDDGNCASDFDADSSDDGSHDYSKRFSSGVKVARQVLRRMNGRHGKRRLSEHH